MQAHCSIFIVPLQILYCDFQDTYQQDIDNREDH